MIPGLLLTILASALRSGMPPEDFLGQYRKAAPAIRAAYGNLDVEYATMGFGANGRVIIDYSSSRIQGFYFCSEFKRTVADGVERKHAWNRSGRNARYEFRLKLNDDYAYEIASLSATPRREWGSGYLVEAGPYAYPGSDRTYLELIEDPGTRVVSVLRRNWHGRACIEFIVAFHVEPAFMPGRRIELRQGICLLPTRNWIAAGIISYDSTAPHKIQHETRFYYRETDETWPALKSYESCYAPPHEDDPLFLHHSKEYSKCERMPPSTDESPFLLSVYGIAELITLPPKVVRGAMFSGPILPPGKPSPKLPPLPPLETPFPWGWALAGPIFIAIIGIVLRRKRKAG